MRSFSFSSISYRLQQVFKNSVLMPCLCVLAAVQSSAFAQPQGSTADADLSHETVSAAATHVDEPIRKLRIGVHYSDLSEFRTKLMEPTLAYLRKSFPQLEFEIIAFDKFELNIAVIRHDVDLFVISSGFFSYLEPSGVTALALRQSPPSRDPSQSTGAVFIARADDARIEVLTDLRSKRAAAASPQSFTGWLVALGEISNVTQYPKNYFGKTYFKNHSGLPIAEAVISKEVDFGILRTCELESLISRGVIAANSLKVIGRKDDDSFACARSTKLYPDLIFASRADLPSDLKRRITVALLSMSADSTSGYGWSVVENLSPTRHLVERLGFSPTEHTPGSSARLDRYKYALLIGVLLLIAAMFYSFLVSRTVAQRTKKLVKVIDEKSELEKMARIDRERLSQLERAGFVSEISSMIAHELRQPVASLINYADGLALYLSDRGKDPIINEATREIAKQAERVASIVERVRAYAKNNTKAHQIVNLCEIIKHAFGSFRSGSDLTGVRIYSNLPTAAFVSGDALELELLVVNCLKNALQAVRRNQNGKGEILIELLAADLSGTQWKLTVQDNGPRISDEQFERLSRPVASEKIEGLGLGLSISRVIAERHAARLEFVRLPAGGLSVSLYIAAKSANEDSSRTIIHESANN